MRQRLSAANAIPPLLQLQGPTSLTDNLTNGGPAKPAATEKPGEIEARQIAIDGQLLEVAVRHGRGQQPPLLLFNGIGANWELAKPLLEALTSTTAIIFDMPGVGGAPRAHLPYRPSTLARLAPRPAYGVGSAALPVCA